MVIKKYENQKARRKDYQFVRYKGVKMQRYRAVWIENNGKIPEGFMIHHKNGIKYDDRIENLECVSRLEHGKLHRIKRKV